MSRAVVSANVIKLKVCTTMVNRMRRPGESPLPTLAVTALSAILSAVAPGCRGAETPTEPGSGSVSVRLEAGSHYRYVVWSLDGFGDRIASTERRRDWDVAASGVSAYGVEDVTVVVDSTEGEPADTIHFRFLESGDIYQYGFLSRWVERSEGKTIPPQWDLIAALSLGRVGNWIVGVADSAGNDVVRGEISGENLLFEVVINGTLTAVPSYRVDLVSSRLLSSIWVTDSPSAFVRFRFDNVFPSNSNGGELAQLTEHTTPLTPL